MRRTVGAGAANDSDPVLYTGDFGIWDTDEVFVEFITGGMMRSSSRMGIYC
jgi:hypothetical protein